MTIISSTRAARSIALNHNLAVTRTARSIALNHTLVVAR